MSHYIDKLFGLFGKKDIEQKMNIEEEKKEEISDKESNIVP